MIEKRDVAMLDGAYLMVFRPSGEEPEESGGQVLHMGMTLHLPGEEANRLVQHLGDVLERELGATRAFGIVTV